MQFGPSNKYPGILKDSTSLTKLTVKCCEYSEGTGDALVQIAALPALRHLVTKEPRYRQYDLPCSSIPATALQKLQTTTHLTLECKRSVDDEALQHLSSLTALQELSVTSHYITAAVLWQLPQLQRLQRLQLCTEPCAKLSIFHKPFSWDCDAAEVITSKLTTLTCLQLAAGRHTACSCAGRPDAAAAAAHQRHRALPTSPCHRS